LNIRIPYLLKTESKADLESCLYAFLLFFATLYFSNEYYYLTIPISVLFFNTQYVLKNKRAILDHGNVKKIVILTIVYLLVSYLNKLINGHPVTSLRDLYASFLLFPVLLFSSAFLNLRKVFKFFLYFVVFEILIGLVEYYYGVRSFFLENVADVNLASDFLYDHRVNGLSLSSSIFSLKLLVAIIAIEFANIKQGLKIILKGLLMMGVLISFNRALIVSILLFWIILFMYNLITCKKYNLRNSLFMAKNFLLFTGIFLLFSDHNILTEMKKKNPEKQQLELKFKSIEEKLTFNDFKESEYTMFFPKIKEGNILDTNLLANKIFYNSAKGFNTSGRTLIWMNYIAYIDQHKWFGFGSDKLLFKSIDQDNKKIKLIHAHNSFLQLIATNGLFISLLFLCIIWMIWTKKNFLFLIPILVFSTFQYGIFWGFSLLDLFFFSILMYNSNLLDEK